MGWAGLPITLARAHRAMAVGTRLTVSVPGGEPGALTDLLAGAGFEVDVVAASGGRVWADVRRARTLADTVAPGQRVLVCGLNPSVVSADAGYGFAGPTNRFWRAAVASGLVTRPRDPLACAHEDGVGMTDLVKRATANAAALAAEEYRAGAARVRRLVEWTGPGIVLFVGLAGWRTAVDRHARPGLQPTGFGGAPAYVMPSTSGLNASASLEILTAHMAAAVALARPA